MLSDVTKQQLFEKAGADEADLGSDEEIFAEANRTTQDLGAMKERVEERLRIKAMMANMD